MSSTHRTAADTDAATARADRFAAELAGVAHDRSSRNAALARLGVVLQVVGVGLTLLGLLLSQVTDNPLDQATDLSLGLAGLALVLVGLGLFVRYSFAQMLRFWLLRLSLEQQERG